MSCNAPEFSWVCKMAPGCERYSRNMIHHLERRGWAGQWMKAQVHNWNLNDVWPPDHIYDLILDLHGKKKKNEHCYCLSCFFVYLFYYFSFIAVGGTVSPQWHCTCAPYLHFSSTFFLLAVAEHLLTPDIFPSTNPFNLIRSYFSFSSDTFLVPSVPSTQNQHFSWCAPYC